MQLKRIKIQNFRNYKEEEIEFNNKINIFYGNNAQGKTNILESIYLMSLGKSYRTNKEKELIKKGESFSKLYCEYNKEDRDGKIEYFISEKKIIKVNGIKIDKLSELVGNINIVMFVPEDIDIMKGSPAKRRKFLNIMIGQLKNNYISNLNLYLKTLEQRNNYIKQKNINNDMLDIWDEKLVEYGYKIYQYRNEFINKIKEKIESIHKNIADEKISLHYISDCSDKENFLKKLKNNRKNDIEKGFTSSGIQRDDFKVYVNGEDVSVYGSQGQNRTAVLSLKLAEIKVIYDEIGEYPILLLDDFMSELDEKRIKNFLKNIEKIQVIITCTKNIKIENSKSFNITDGKVIK